MQELAVALALVLVIEGVLYAAAPSAMKRMMLQVLQVNDEQLRMMGLACAVIGVGLIWALRNFL
jgi:uncharacterized protein